MIALFKDLRKPTPLGFRVKTPRGPGYAQYVRGPTLLYFGADTPEDRICSVYIQCILSTRRFSRGVGPRI